MEKHTTFGRSSPRNEDELFFMSTATLERSLDGSEERFADYFFAVYHCSPTELNGINERRNELRRQYPANVIEVGTRFIPAGEAAYQALGGYYRALALSETLSVELRKYADNRFVEITKLHNDSQALPVPIDLLEGQMANDNQLELLACIAIRNGQIFSKTKE